MKNVTENYISVREAVAKKLLKDKDGVYVAYLLSIILKKMQHESNGGGHFNVNPDTVLVQKEEGETPKVKLIGEENPHEACNGKTDFDTEALNQCFRAPETFLGKFSPASDVYSVGMLMAFMLQGAYPYNIDESMKKADILKEVKGNEPDLEIDVPVRLVVKRSLNKTSTRRFKDAEELGLSLMTILGIEKPKNFSCFSDSAKDKINEANKDMKKDKEDGDMKEMRQSPQEPHLDVDMSVRVGEGFKAVAGMDDIKKKLRRDFVEIVSHRELAKEFGIMPSNMLFYGAPGTGKTFISERLAEECGMSVCSVKPSDLGSIWLHGSQGLIKELFTKAAFKAKQNKCGCILLIDEFDALCGARDARGNEHQADEVAEWLTQLNDCVEKNVFVIGTTNCLDRIDKAVIRHGRIDQVLYIGLPDEECRKQLFEIELNKRPHDTNINVEELARLTDGYTSSDISYMVKETARNAFEACLQHEEERFHEAESIDQTRLDYAEARKRSDEIQPIIKISETMLRDVIKATRPSVSREDIRRYEKMRDEFVENNRKERPRIGFTA